MCRGVVALRNTTYKIGVVRAKSQNLRNFALAGPSTRAPLFAIPRSSANVDPTKWWRNRKLTPKMKTCNIILRTRYVLAGAPFVRVSISYYIYNTLMANPVQFFRQRLRSYQVTNNEKTRFLRWYNLICDREDKRNRCWAPERKCISILNSSNYATTHGRKKSRRTGKIGQNQPFWTKWWVSHKISFVRKIPEKALRVFYMNEMKLPWSIQKSHTRLLRINWNKTTFQIHIFARIPTNLSSLW